MPFLPRRSIVAVNMFPKRSSYMSLVSLDGGTIQGSGGLLIASAPPGKQQFDTLLVIGGQNIPERTQGDLDAIRSYAASARRVASCEIAPSNDPTRLAVYLVELFANNRVLRDRALRPIVTHQIHLFPSECNTLHVVWGGVIVGRNFTMTASERHGHLVLQLQSGPNGDATPK